MKEQDELSEVHFVFRTTLAFSWGILLLTIGLLMETSLWSLGVIVLASVWTSFLVIWGSVII